jgi:hypothetical protein
MDAWVIAAACMSRGLTPAESRSVHTVLTNQLATPDALTAAQAQKALEAAINAVLRQSRNFTLFDDDPTPPPGGGGTTGVPKI